MCIKRERSVCVGMIKRFGNVACDINVYFFLTATVLRDPTNIKLLMLINLELTVLQRSQLLLKSVRLL